MSKPNIETRLSLTPDDPLYDLFLKVKEKIGINTNSDVLRHAFKKGCETILGINDEQGDE
jgi:hypothetical protein